MAIIGIQLDRTNPDFTIDDFIIWMPQYTKFMATDKGKKYFDKLSKVANNKVFHSIFGSDWELAMSLCIAHYLTLISNQIQNPSGDTLESVAGGGVYRGAISSASVGGFSKSFDLNQTMIDSDDAKFWNLTSFGAQFMALLLTKSVPTIFVVTNNNIPGAN